MIDKETYTPEWTTIWYEFSLTCGCLKEIHVDPDTYEPPDGVYRCDDCGAEEFAWKP